MSPGPNLDWNFPFAHELREVRVAPVFLEPMAHSGELLCVGVVARMGDSSGALVLPGMRRFRCLYGETYRTIEVAAECAIASLLAHVREQGLTEQTQLEWTSPVGGVTLGTVTTTTSRSLAQVMDVYLRAHSSLASIGDVSAVDEREERSASLSSARLERLVKEVVLNVRVDLSGNFNRLFRIASDARPLKLGYAGTRVVANFGLLWPTQLSGAVRSSKAKLWDLAQARDGSKQGWFGAAAPQAFELLVHPATVEDVVFSEIALGNVKAALAELEAEADQYDLRCRPLRGPEAMADFLIQAESQPA